MRAYGNKRTFGGCRVVRAGYGRKIKIRQFTKNHKHGRKWVSE